MVIWGAVWGAIIGMLQFDGSDGFGLFVGVAVGAFAGWTLQRAVRKEVAQQMARQAQMVPDTTDLNRSPPIADSSPWDDTADDGIAAPAATTRPASGAAAAPAPAPGSTPVSAPVAALSETANAAGPGTPGTQAAPLAPTNPYASLSARLAAKPVDELAVVGRLVDMARNWLLGGNTIVRLGLLVLFVGLAFLAKYAAEHSMLPPELRLAGIGIAGIALFVFGLRVSRRQDHRSAYALALQGGGVAVMYLTVFAAFRLYQFLPAGAAFGALALVCAFSTAIALMQNAMPMAFIGFAGAFAAPLLVSTGQGNHVALFGYYLLLGVAIAVVAWLRAWRPLNLLGFVATFGVATAWGVLSYKVEHYASTQLFLIAFFLVYLVASLLYATRHSLAPKQAVDATLIFGTPLAAFGLQAGLVRDGEYATGLSSLVLGAFYLGLGFWALRRSRTDNGVGRWMAECFVALGLGFATLAVPLALDPHWTAAVWAAEGAAVYWMGQRQQRWLARAIGLALQVFAALSYLSTLQHAPVAHWPLANPVFTGAALLAASAFALAHWLRQAQPQSDSAMALRFAAWEQQLSPVLFWVGFLWLQFALGQEIGRVDTDVQGQLQPVLQPALHHPLMMLAWLASAFVVHRLALTDRSRPWPIAATPAWCGLPIMLLVALEGLASWRLGFEAVGIIVWLLALVLHGLMLHRLDTGAPQRLWSWTHSGGIWLLVLLIGNALAWAIRQGDLYRTAWAAVILLVAATSVLLLLTRRAGFDAESAIRWRWPLHRFADAYLWRAAAPLAVMVAFGSLAAALHSNGDARPLPYLPIINPTDLAVALGLAACALWLTRIRASQFAVPGWMHHPRLPLMLVGLAFVAINTVWLRIAHQYAGVPWNADHLFESFLVQAGYSILWTLLALALMVAAHRRQTRSMWMGGAFLLGATVLKLFLIDLSNRGGSERIVVFIAVGVLMLVVGYFAPLPPRASVPVDDKEPSPEPTA